MASPESLSRELPFHPASPTSASPSRSSSHSERSPSPSVSTPTPSSTNEATGTEDLRILKGTSADDLKPFMLHKISDSVKTLTELRASLGTLMKKSDGFLTVDNFPIDADKKSETARKLVDVLRTHDGGSKAIAIISVESSPARTPLTPPTLSDTHKFDPLPDRKPIAIPAAAEIPVAEAYDGAAPPNAEQLSEAQAKTVIQTNCLLHGVCLNHSENPRAFKALYCLPVGGTYKELLEVCDQAKMDSRTTYSANQAALAKQGFDEVSAQIGTPWVSVSASASRSTESSHSTSTSKQLITAMYLYPRAAVELDPEELVPSSPFLSRLADALKEDQDPATRRAKFTKLTEHFGDGFAKKVQVGGMLHTTKEVDSNETGTHSAQADALKLALAAKVEFVSVGVSGEHSSKESSDSVTAGSDSHLTIEAVGGETTLATNPTAWPASVMPFANWRTMKISDVTLLTDLPNLVTPAQKTLIEGLFPKWEGKRIIAVHANTSNFLAPGFVPATVYGAKEPHLCFRQHPFDPNPNTPPVFCPTDSYTEVVTSASPPDGMKLWQPVTKEGGYVATTLVLSAETPGEWAAEWAKCVSTELLEVDGDEKVSNLVLVETFRGTKSYSVKTPGWSYVFRGAEGVPGVGWWEAIDIVNLPELRWKLDKSTYQVMTYPAFSG